VQDALPAREVSLALRLNATWYELSKSMIKLLQSKNNRTRLLYKSFIKATDCNKDLVKAP
jgi:hypothetical protein